MSRFEARAHLKVRDGQLEGFKRQAAEMMRVTREKDTGTLAYDWFLSKDGAECEVHEAYVDADALVEHALNVREARAAMFAEFAYDHQMAFYGDPSPRLIAFVKKIGVDRKWFTLPAGSRAWRGVHHLASTPILFTKAMSRGDGSP